MDNMGGEQHDQETFKAVYDQDPVVQNLVASFDPEGVVLKGGEEVTPPAQGDDTVDQMAQSATSNAMSQ
jgi:hypothetical protein